MNVQRHTSWNRVSWINEAFNLDLGSLQAERLFESNVPQRIFKNDKTTSVSLHKLHNHQVVAKRYNARNSWHKIKRAFRQSRARRCWLMSELFQQLGLQVPNPLLMMEYKFGPIHKNAFFVNQFIDGDVLIDALPAMTQTEQNQVHNAVVNAFKIMRRHKISHGDLKASNLLWIDQTLFFIDLDAATKHQSQWLWQRAHNKDKKRFLKNWVDHRELRNLFADL